LGKASTSLNRRSPTFGERGAGLTVNMAPVLVMDPTELVTVTENTEPLSAGMVTVVGVKEVCVAPTMGDPFQFH